LAYAYAGSNPASSTTAKTISWVGEQAVLALVRSVGLTPRAGVVQW
jgi:hypothetical protein